MAAITTDVRGLITALSPEVTNRFIRGYAAALAAQKPWWKDLIDRIPTENDNQNVLLEVDKDYLAFAPIGTAPQISPVEGKYWPVKLEKVLPTGASILVTQMKDRVALEFLKRKIDGMAQYAANANRIKLIDWLRTGDTNPAYLGYDGQQFFSSSHTVGASAASYDNLEPGDAIATDNLTSDNVFAIMAKLRSVPAGPGGRPYPLVDPIFYLIVPPQLEKAAKEIANNTWSPESGRFTENVLKGSINVIVDQDLATEPATWYVALSDQMVKPFMTLYMDTPDSGMVVPLIAPTDPNVLHLDRFEWYMKLFENTIGIRFEFVVKVVGTP